ncbi:MAG: hypothetical protein PHP37_00640 [Patescibacteria group bacterium]|nr:hypothetical protein [Patescibacteria group bacterium]
MNKDYKISPSFYLIHDKKSVNFHVKKNDYFGTLATIIELINQDNVLENKEELKKLLKRLKKDLLYLQENFIIKKKI